MKAHIIKDKSSTYTRISKLTARSLYYSGLDNLALCPVNLRPGFPFSPHMTLGNYLSDKTREEFDKIVNSFEMYNCTCSETGTYAAFYLITDNQ